MGTLYLIRHGQASFGAADYDQLSALGHQQSVRLGEYLRPKLQSQPLEAVMMGSLKRHRQTWEGIAEGAGLHHTPSVWPGLNEYDSHALIEAIHPEPLAKPDTPELYRHHFRLLRDALQAWMAGRTQPRDMPSYADFVGGIEAALDIITGGNGRDVLLGGLGGDQLLGDAGDDGSSTDRRPRAGGAAGKNAGCLGGWDGVWAMSLTTPHQTS